MEISLTWIENLCENNPLNNVWIEFWLVCDCKNEWISGEVFSLKKFHVTSRR